jgi:hypothetical protein
MSTWLRNVGPDAWHLTWALSCPARDISREQLAADLALQAKQTKNKTNSKQTNKQTDKRNFSK